ncbi:hypothetical protein [Amycolatopsis sp. NBC_01480]|uniref:hypothetical protein n=1 Tax=Amycolatopsis sp. NBC_01480 TaxID=2903562 RepID=UPI002E2C02A3|nr:hypothetical protein [Amycolatopsis sp. NBC_01480]
MDSAVTWACSSRRLQLRADDHVHRVPRDIAADLFVFFRTGLTEHAGADLVELERHYRLIALNGELYWQVARSATAADPRAPDRRSLWRQSKSADARLRQLRRQADALHEARRKILRLRRFVLSLDVTGGALGAASRGWARASDRPVSVSSVWTDAAAFVRHDPRRGLAGSAVAGAVGAVPLGFRWRRDGDDDPSVQDVGFGGTWAVGYVQATRELYAHRTSPHRSEEVWLLAANVPSIYIPRVRQLHRRAAEPNSLIRLARAAEVAVAGIGGTGAGGYVAMTTCARPRLETPARGPPRFSRAPPNPAVFYSTSVVGHHRTTRN